MKKILVIGLLFFLVLSSSWAQDKNCLKDVGDKMCLVSTEGKYGIINKKGEYIVPAYFDTIEVYAFGFIVNQTGKYGAFDRKGKIIVPIEFSGVRCVGDCEKEMLVEISDIGVRSIYITKKMDIIKGMKKVTPLLSVSEHEVTIKEWFVYVQNVKENGFNYNYGYLETIPDTNQVENKLRLAYRAFLKGVSSDKQEDYAEVKCTFGFDELVKMKTFYDDHILTKKSEGMMDFPVTGLTHKQVQRYMEWLNIVNRKQMTVTGDLSYEINFRLPKMEEWESISKNGLPERYRKNKCIDSLDTDGNLRFNYKVPAGTKSLDQLIAKNFGEGSTTVEYNWSDFNGIFGLYGNVAEMLFENGLAKGGSYFHPAKNAAWDKTLKYQGAQPWLGFRVVAEFKALK